MKNKKIFIHAGPGKTGSSAIQSWLCKNQGWLSENDIFYPPHSLFEHEVSSGNRHCILSLIKDKWVPDKNKIKALFDEFSERDEKTLLLSSEFFFHNIIPLAKLFPTACFIVYIRNPVILFESGYNQSVKRHSFIKKLHIPQNIENHLWEYLGTLCKKINKNRLFLRAYNDDLFVNGNIVSDLLSVLRVNREIESDRINSSYTLASLEFKRLINHFPLENLQPGLDTVLQGCQIGKQSYSLMQPDSYRTLSEQTCKKMRLFIDSYNQQHLIPLWEKFLTTPQNTPCTQETTLDELHAVGIYIKGKNLKLYLALQSMISNHPNLFIDNPDIYSVFDIAHQPCTTEKLIDESLEQAVNKSTIAPSKRGTVLCELSNHFEQQDDHSNAFQFAKAALYYHPNNHVFKQRLNSLLVKENNKFLSFFKEISSVPKEKKANFSSRKQLFSFKTLKMIKNKFSLSRNN